ncbi:D-alanine--D-alanine ligase [Blochmannia endosymbiont of Camponotus sp. C-003]|uniref:D-alanine--D-alanine ligase family protein n=1 Tax=unclassified Candidatus Blochmanniella TaxID=711328 RepID=UPI0020248CEC|nr:MULTISPECIES: D-alanine--D-alanine ligase family protein [unclassified Candidatus Blochmannia]URJ23356.1 D-alanine--D-alanine ligase [Blochmannia endosymbiont of Camponotus sp. C-003]URJ28829.1 D-alanine--D-alanine ligase [Blochmannia endosymbiont of Camponotus sp. C-046]
MSKLCIGIICGGCSLEHDISLKSAMCIAQFIDKFRFEVMILWIDKKGYWHLKDVNFNNLSYHKNDRISILLQNCPHQFELRTKNINFLLKFDVIFPVIHGSLGEDGALQGLLCMMNLPFVGSNVLSSSIGMDKEVSKCLLRDAGLSVVPFKTVLDQDQHNIDFDDLVSIFGLPLFVKPSNQGSSIGVSKVTQRKDFNLALMKAFSFSSKILIEPAIIGRELECAVLGNENPEISVCGEVILSGDDFYTYDNKYMKHTVQTMIPALIKDTISDDIRHVALRAFQVLNCSGMARVDVFLNLNNKVFINEVNTLPGFTCDSMYPKLWEASGLNFQALITKLLELALDLHDKNHYSYHVDDGTSA